MQNLRLIEEVGVTEENIAILVLVCNGETWADRDNFHSGNLVTLLNGAPLPPDDFIVTSDGRHVRHIDFRLSPNGTKQALAAQKAINNLREAYGPGVLVASPEERSLQTANGATRNGDDFKEKLILEGLMDRGQGTNVGISKSPRNALLDPFPNPITDKTGFENLSTFAVRVRNVWDQNITPLLINKKFPVIFTHRYVIAAVLKLFDPKVDIEEVGERISNCKPIVLVIRMGKGVDGHPLERLLKVFYYEPV